MTDLQWKIFGLSFQACFMGRFLVQWIASERAGRSVVPTAFWYFSLVGAAGLLSYAVIHLQDPVFAIGQSTGFIIYIRNLMLIRKARLKEEALAAEEAAGKGDDVEGGE